MVDDGSKVVGASKNDDKIAMLMISLKGAVYHSEREGREHGQE